MNAFETPAEEFHSLAIALLRAQQTRQWLLDVEKPRIEALLEGRSHHNYVQCWYISRTVVFSRYT